MALHPGTTDGALRGHDLGIVTACSVVASGPDLDRAVHELRARPELAVGLHLVLAGAPLVSTPVEAPSLFARGRPLSGHGPFLLRLAAGRIRLRDVEVEARAQIVRARDAGLRVTHLNGHQHLHVAPGVVGVVIRLAREYGIGYVRVPLEPGWPLTPRAAQLTGLAALALRARAILRRAGIRTNDRAAGLRHAGHLTPARLAAAVASIRGTTELVTHPGAGNEALARSLAYGYDWDSELAALCDARVRAAIERRAISLSRPA